MNDKIREAFEWQIAACRALGSPLTADVLGGLCAALDHTTRTGTRILDWPGDPKTDALKLRIAGGLNALARSGKDPAFTALYAARAGDWAGELRRILVQYDDWLYPWLDNAPQTNEVGRSGILWPGMMEIARRFGPKLEILELGASAGLNLNMDRFSYDLGGVKSGDLSSAVTLSPVWQGTPPANAAVEIVARCGVDLNPLDVNNAAVAAQMMAYVWPDQAERVARTGAALNIAQAHPPRVEKGDGADWIGRKLDEPQDFGVTRVIYHSIALQYFPKTGQERVKSAIIEAGKHATQERPLAWLAMEFQSMTESPELTLHSWPGTGAREKLANCHPHGATIEWLV